MGKPNATREEIMAALHNAQCDDILEKLPRGADTVIGTKGCVPFRRRTTADCHRPRDAEKCAWS